MSLCRYLPTVSDRMGVLWSLLNINDAVVLEYGPAGTTHFGAGFFMGMGIKQENRYFTTHMSEDDVVMGDVSRLEKAIFELDQDIEPKTIFVVASSISAVIGTDLKGVCNYMQDKINARLITFEHAGLRGDYSAGLLDTYDLLVKELVEPCESLKPKSYNIIGASYENYRMISDVNEINFLMKTAFDFDVHASLCTNTSMDSIASMSCASVNLVISYEGLEAAKYLKEKFGTPYVYGAPFGYKGTLKWLENIAGELNETINPTFVEEIEERIADMLFYPRYKMMLGDKARAFIYADYDKLIGLSSMMDEFSITTEFKICKHALKYVKEPQDGIQCITVEKERVDILKDNKDMIVLADAISMMITDPSNTTLRVSTPLGKGQQVAVHMPFMGLKGMDFVKETIDQYFGKFFR